VLIANQNIERLESHNWCGWAGLAWAGLGWSAPLFPPQRVPPHIASAPTTLPAAHKKGPAKVPFKPELPY